MLSRVANLIYWMARYLERAENTARIVDVNTQLVLDLQSRQAADDPRSWKPLVYVSGGDKQYQKLHGADITERAVVDFMLFDRDHHSSMVSCVSSARENARCIRDQLASEVWEQLNSLYLKLREDDYTRYAQLGASEYTMRVKTQIQLIYGIAESMLPRNEMRWFFEPGRHLERADNTSRIIDVKYYTLLPSLEAVGSALDIVQWAAVLRTCSAFEAFRKSRRGQLNLEPVVDYLLRDESFPRSVLYSIRQAGMALDCITAEAPHLADNPAQTLITKLHEALDQTVVREMIVSGLHEYVDQVQLDVAAIHAAVQKTFINYSTDGAKLLN